MLRTLGIASRSAHSLLRRPIVAVALPGVAPFTGTAVARKVQYPPRPKPPPDSEIHESFLKGSGPGGQKINKTNSAVQLKHIPTGIVVKCQETRSRDQNRKLARQHLADKLDDLQNGENSRSAVIARIKSRRKASATKKSRRKHRQLGEDGDEDGPEGGVQAEELLETPEGDIEHGVGTEHKAGLKK